LENDLSCFALLQDSGFPGAYTQRLCGPEHESEALEVQLNIREQQNVLDHEVQRLQKTVAGGNPQHHSHRNATAC